MDYCNSLLVNTSNEQLNSLQKVQNNAARLILRKNKFTPTTPLLKELHWLPVRKRIMYKICSIVFKCLHDQCPVYLKELIHIYSPQRNLRSSEDTTILIKKNASRKIGERTFFFSAPHLWNSLPKDLRKTVNLEHFKTRLKT